MKSRGTFLRARNRKATFGLVSSFDFSSMLDLSVVLDRDLGRLSLTKAKTQNMRNMEKTGFERSTSNWRMGREALFLPMALRCGSHVMLGEEFAEN